ncbi:MAG: hypothetical protein JWO67_1269 [Streptosporangiaceae bacterium]|nr:hypothetical protein [Streptosporangiaceae bacterium]
MTVAPTPGPRSATRTRRVAVFVAVTALAALITRVAIGLSGRHDLLGAAFGWRSALMVVGWWTVVDWLFTGIGLLWRRVRDRKRRRPAHRKA